MRPSDDWRWYFDNKYDCLMLELSNDLIFRSHYSSKMLVPDAFCSFPFSITNATTYHEFYESCNQLNLTESKKIELVLNAIVASNFLKPQMPKSWYFSQQPMLFVPTCAEIVEAQVQNSEQRINLLVIEVGESASVCLFTEPNISIVGKNFVFSDVLKIMNDRLTSKTNGIINKKREPELEERNEAIVNLF